MTPPRSRPALIFFPQEHPWTSRPPSARPKGCRETAVWELLWNNPKLHTPERRKSWVACEEHRHSLADFLTARGFLRDVEPLG